MIRENKTFQIPNLMQVGQGLGMQTMDMALERYFREGQISAETALRKGRRQGELRPLSQARVKRLRFSD